MKQFLLLLLSLLTLNTFSQSLVENKVDEFTKTKILKTSWEPLTRKQNFYLFTSARSLNGDILLDFKVNLRRIFAIREEGSIYLKLSNDSIVVLKSTNTKISCKGCASVGLTTEYMEGVETSATIAPDVLELLIKNPVVKVRFNTTIGYIEEDIKEKAGYFVMNQLKLVQ
jgi:hypothetical protein